MAKPHYTISQVIATPEGQWVNAEITATLTDPKPPRGKGPWSATLSDSTGSILGKFWGGAIDHWAGKRVKLSGAGMQRKAYNGTPEISIGQKADISAAPAGDSHPDLEAAPSKPATQQKPQAPAGTPIHGATVGMAVKAAVDVWIASRASRPWEEGGAEFVEGTARQICAISQRIESGAVSEDVPF